MQLINDLLKKPSQNSIGGRKYHDMACDSKNVWFVSKIPNAIKKSTIF